MTRFTVVHQEELAQVTDSLTWQARGLFLELLLAADYVTGMVPATSREQVRVWTGRSWSATANHLDELGKAGLIVEAPSGIQVTVYPQVTDPRGEREVLRGKRERDPRSLAVSARLTCVNGTTSSNYKTTADGFRFVPGEGWVRIEQEVD